MKLLSIVLPSYNEERMIEKSANVIGSLLQKEAISYEIIFVDDGSKDDTWRTITHTSENDAHIVGVHFSRNFGKEAAIMAGLAQAKGDCCVVMDCDLQHPPEQVVEMYRLWESGYEIVEGVKSSRGQEGRIHKFCAKMFYNLLSKAVSIDMSRASDFKLLDRKAVDALLMMEEKNAFFRALSSWIGFESIQIEFDVQERQEGESKWSTKSLIKYAITNIAAFSTVPMQIVTFLGVVTFFFAIIMSVDTLVNYFKGTAATGFTTVILMLLFIGSIIMISLGIIGYYIAKIYEEIKCRPRYIVSKIVGNK